MKKKGDPDCFGKGERRTSHQEQGEVSRTGNRKPFQYTLEETQEEIEHETIHEIKK
jgi:hypothetical protein